MNASTLTGSQFKGRGGKIAHAVPLIVVYVTFVKTLLDMA